MGSRSMQIGNFERDTSGFPPTLPSNVPSGRDVGISLHAIDQRADWPAAEVEYHIKYSHFPMKNPLCYAASHQKSLTTCLLIR